MDAFIKSLLMKINERLRLQIREKLIIAFIGLSVIPILLLGSFSLFSNTRAMRNSAQESLINNLLSIRQRLNLFAQELRTSCGILSSTASFADYLSHLDDDQDASVGPTPTHPWCKEMQQYISMKPYLYQIIFLDERFEPRFGVSHLNQRIHVVPEAELNQIGTRFFKHVVETMGMQHTIFIPTELLSSADHRALPMFCFISPVKRADHYISGMFVVYIRAQHVFQLIDNEWKWADKGKLMLVNKEGYYLYHSQKKKDWNRLLAKKDTMNLFSDYNGGTATKLLSADVPKTIEWHDELLASAPLFQRGNEISRYYHLVVSLYKKDVFAGVNQFKWVFLVSIVFFLFLSLFLGYTATKQFTEPIKKLHHKAKIIAKGDYHARVTIRTYDEIDDLAEQFNIMAQALEERERELLQHRKRLEEMVVARTAELARERDKLKVILDNVPHGFVLLDQQLQVMVVSAAMKDITGKPVTKLVGKQCCELIECQNCEGMCPSMKAFRSGETCIEQSTIRNSSGEEVLLEHVAVPLKSDGRVIHVLEVITDITDRTRLQEQLIRSERLATTGEIAAVIAHEMRNNLTSLRMILQLLLEAESPAREEKESLTVALDSINRMERVVSDLLQLARPAPMIMKPDEINEVVRESIAMARHDIQRKGIALQVELTPDIPLIPMDRNFIKEAMINLLINASQAMEDRGSIRVVTRCDVISEELHDFVETEQEDDHTVSVQEIRIKSGTKVLMVSVSDTGKGMEPEVISRIFNAFFTTKTNGTGLGLSLVKRVVNRHGGVVLVDSRPGVGSTFTLVIPLIPVSEAESVVLTATRSGEPLRRRRG